MWRILEHRLVAKSLDSRRVPRDVVERYEVWKAIVSSAGPQGLRSIRGLRDEALAGEWWGFRSSRLTGQWRVIYRVEAEVLLVQVIRIGAHDYRRA